MTHRIWHTSSIADVVQALDVDLSNGLSDAEAANRRSQYGPNELQERGGISPIRLLWAQFTNNMVLILIAAAVVSGFLGKVTETAAIAAIVVLFALLGFVQEYRAERAMAALKRLTVPVVRARRNGELRELSAKELVPGDVVLLEPPCAREICRGPNIPRGPQHKIADAQTNVPVRQTGSCGAARRREDPTVARHARAARAAIHNPRFQKTRSAA